MSLRWAADFHDVATAILDVVDDELGEAGGYQSDVDVFGELTVTEAALLSIAHSLAALAGFARLEREDLDDVKQEAIG